MESWFMAPSKLIHSLIYSYFYLLRSNISLPKIISIYFLFELIVARINLYCHNYDQKYSNLHLFEADL